MVRLIVEENGNRRAFRLGEGVLTIGSGEGARLRLTSPDVAELHAEIEYSQAEGARLRPRPGVLPPKLAGAPVTGVVPLELDLAFEVGSARMWLQSDQGPIQTPRSTTAVAGRGGGPNDAARIVRREAAMRQARKGARRSVVQRTQPRVKRGLPSGVVVLLILGGAAAFLFAGSRMFRSASEAGFDVDATIAVARRQIEESTFASARAKLASIPAEIELTDAQREAIAELEQRMRDREAQIELSLENQRGTQWMDVYLKRYEQRYLQGTPETAKVRMFLKRCKEFRERWPQHEELAWVRRQEARFADLVDLDRPATFEEIEWEIWLLTNTSPRNYVAAFALLDEYLERESAPAASEALELREKLVAERAEYHVDRLHQADYEYNKKESPAQAVWWLVHSVIWLGDEEMADEAARYLLRIPRLEEHLDGYRSKYPEKFEGLMRNERLRDFAREKGLLD